MSQSTVHLFPQFPSIFDIKHQLPTVILHRPKTKGRLLASIAPLALVIVLNSPSPSLALPPTTPFTQSQALDIGLDNGKIRPCPSVNPGCVSSNPKSSSFSFPWIIPENSYENATQKLRDAILKTQRNVKFQVDQETPDGHYLQAEVDGGFGRDVMEFLVKRDVVAFRSMATKVTYVYPFTTAFGNSKGQDERLNKIKEELGWLQNKRSMLIKCYNCCKHPGKLSAFLSNRWLVFVAAMWVQSCAGIGYLFGSISPVIKYSLGYNQRQIARLGVAKDLGDCVGFLAGALCEILPLWAAMLVGALQNLVGYGWTWLIVTERAPALPLWGMCILIFFGTNGETYFNTAALVSCVQNFPKSRGPIVGILKGFAGLSGAILTQIYAMMNSPDHAALIFMVAVGPSMVVISLMFIVRPVGGHRQMRSTDKSSFMFIYSVCLLLASYLMGVMLLEDLVELNQIVIILFTTVLVVLLVVPILIPLMLTFYFDATSPFQECLLPEPEKDELNKSSENAVHNEVILSEVEDEKPKDVDLLPEVERQKRIAQLQAKLFQAAAVGAVSVKRRKGPRRGEDFTLMQALIKADFWLIFVSLLLGAGSGLTVIDNLGQMSQSLGYDDTHIFVSMISIWNFLGRIAGGYFSEIIVRDHAYPRPVAMAVAQVVMAVGHLFFAMGWPGTMYIGTLLIGLGFGAHWAIVPAAASELFGLKNFGTLYNFLTVANPAGSLIFSGLIASVIYDHEAEKQSRMHYSTTSLARRLLYDTQPYLDEPLKCEGAICFYLTSLIMSGLCIMAVILSMILVHRTKIVYAHLYGKAHT